MSELFNMVNNEPVNKLKGIMPKIGIRPVIDGRCKGIRESLENQTMNMAKSAASLITENLKHANGLPVECIIPSFCIGGVAEAAECDEKFLQEGVGATLTVTPCWCYGFETIDMNPLIPKAIWGFNGTERPGAVYLAAALAAYSQKGLPAFGIYGKDVRDADDATIPDDVKQKILAYAKSALAFAYMRGKSYLSIGSVSMGIAGSMVDANFFQSYLGMRNEYVDMSEITRRIDEKIYDQEEFERALKWTKANCKEGKDNNTSDMQKSRKQKDEDWEVVVKMSLIMRDLMVGNSKLKEAGFYEESLGRNAILSGFQGQRHWTDHFPNGDFTETILNSSFDWNGIRAPYLITTENDSLNGVAMLLGYMLTGTAQVFADVRTYWSPDAIKRVTGITPTGLAANGMIHLLNSGAAALDGTGEQSAANGDPCIKPFWDITADEVKRCLEVTQFRPANTGYFRGGGFSADFKSRGGMPVTMSRVNLIKGLGPVLQIAEGYTVEVEPAIHDIIDARTDPTWPTTWYTPILTGKGAFTDVYSVMNYWGANHGSFSYGHIGGDLITLASMLRIPVSMHNVSNDRIFKPSAWNAFGTVDLESTDYRACANYGPVYGKYGG